jgi:hypothetical protein
MLHRFRRVTVAVLALQIAACGSPAPSAQIVPTPSAQTVPTPLATPEATPAATPSATAGPAIVPPSDAAAYLMGEPVTVALDANGAATLALPGTTPTIGGEPARGYALLPATCPAVGAFRIEFDGAPFAAPSWASSLSKPQFQFTMWPSPGSVIFCAPDQSSRNTHLKTGYRPFSPGAEAVVTVSRANGWTGSLPASLSLVPVYVASEDPMPYFGAIDSFTRVPNPADLTSKARYSETKPRLIGTSMFSASMLPDGSLSDHFNYELTGCAGGTAHMARYSMTVDGGAPLHIGDCTGGMTNQQNILPAPTESVRISLSSTGGWPGAAYRLTCFQWREDPAATP